MPARSTQAAPAVTWIPAATAPPSMEAVSVMSWDRAFAVTRVISAGSRRGVTDARDHAVRLLQHQDAERRGQQRHRVVDRGRHPPAEQAAGQQGAGQQVATALLHAVQGRPDERREHRERRHRHQQEEHHPAAGLIHRRAEEDRPGQRHGDERVAGAAGGGQFDERGQAGPPGPRGAGHPVHEAAGPAGRGGAGPRAGPDRAARGAGRATGSPHRLGQPHVTSILGSRHCGDPTP